MGPLCWKLQSHPPTFNNLWPARPTNTFRQLGPVGTIIEGDAIIIETQVGPALVSQLPTESLKYHETCSPSWVHRPYMTTLCFCGATRLDILFRALATSYLLLDSPRLETWLCIAPGLEDFPLNSTAETQDKVIVDCPRRQKRHLALRYRRKCSHSF